MEITGRITKDAVVNQIKEERQVVNFTVAINDYYKPKNSNEAKNITTYVNCSYWLSSRIAESLTKGTLVELSGRICVNAYKDFEGNAKASLTLHVNNIKVHGKLRGAKTIEQEAVQSRASVTEPMEDLPF
jgi:single-strand DNA-binding protein